MPSARNSSPRACSSKTPRTASAGNESSRNQTWNQSMKINSKAVHVGDRKKAGAFVPVTTPVYTATSFTYDSMETLDRVLGREEPGFSYARYDSPTANGLEELITDLEGGAGTLTCSSGMTAVHVAITTALIDRRRNII